MEVHPTRRGVFRGSYSVYTVYIFDKEFQFSFSQRPFTSSLTLLYLITMSNLVGALSETKDATEETKMICDQVSFSLPSFFTTCADNTVGLHFHSGFAVFS